MKPVSWARVWAAVKPPHSRSLRAGTWYAVVRDELPDRVSLVLGERIVDVPRRVVEVRRRRPEEFSVVYGKHGLSRPEGEAARGPRYAVCPTCTSRFEIAPSLPRAICPECGHRGEIEW